MTTGEDVEEVKPKPVHWVASSRKDLRKFPKTVRSTFGQALYDAQTGKKHPDAKPLRGFGGAGVKFEGIVYVLHAFQKKSKAGIKTPTEEIEKVRSRMKEVQKHYAEWPKQKKRESEGDL